MEKELVDKYVRKHIRFERNTIHLPNGVVDFDYQVDFDYKVTEIFSLEDVFSLRKWFAEQMGDKRYRIVYDDGREVWYKGGKVCDLSGPYFKVNLITMVIYLITLFTTDNDWICIPIVILYGISLFTYKRIIKEYYLRK